MTASREPWTDADAYDATCPDCGHPVRRHTAHGCNLCRHLTDQQSKWCLLTNETVLDRVQEEGR